MLFSLEKKVTMITLRIPHRLRKVLKRNFIPPLSACCVSSSANTNPVVEKSKADGDQKVTLGRKVKLPQREPLVKNFMLGIVDKELLRYPEVMSRDDTGKVAEETAAAQSFFKDVLDRKTIESTFCIPAETIQHLKDLGVFSFGIPESNGGNGYNFTELSVASEPEQVSADIAAILMPHRVVSEVISGFGSDFLKDKYLSKMASGSCVATEAIFESTPADARFFGTTAEYNEADKSWTLNGEKSFVVNATNADLFLVLAQVSVVNTSGNMEDRIAIFLVDSKLPGVEIEKNIAFGIKGAEHGNVKLSKVCVSEENMIGDTNTANNIAQSLLKFNRIKSGIVSIGMLKNLTLDMVQYATNMKYNGVYLKDMKFIGDRLANMVCSTYALESMAYLTCGLADEFEDQDVDLEAAILKLHSLETLWKCATSCMEYVGPKCLENGQRTELYLRNAAQLYTQNETLDSLRQYIGLSGLQFAGMHMFDAVRKDRNPFNFPMHVLKGLFENQPIDSPKMTLKLEFEVHPSLDLAAKNLEQSIVRLRIATKILLARYGNEILNEPTEVVRIAECLSLIYGMFASIARASRSYCIGLQYSDYELLMATILATEGAGRIYTLTKDISNGPFMTNDKNRQKIAKQLFKSQQYFYTHPLKYNF